MNEDSFDTGEVIAWREELATLKERHRLLDAEIASLEFQESQEFKLQALKREKLRMKDRIAWLTAKVTPDIIA